MCFINLGGMQANKDRIPGSGEHKVPGDPTEKNKEQIKITNGTPSGHDRFVYLNFPPLRFTL